MVLAFFCSRPFGSQTFLFVTSIFEHHTVTNNPITYLFTQLSDCCKEHYQWNYETCLGSASTASSGLYYPDYDDSAHICKNDGNAPQYMTNYPSVWMHSTLLDCCNVNYSWNFNACMGSASAGPTGKYFISWSVGKCIEDGGGLGNAENWDILYDSLIQCCNERNWWNDECTD